jgi:hypothetical protein
MWMPLLGWSLVGRAANKTFVSVGVQAALRERLFRECTVYRCWNGRSGCRCLFVCSPQYRTAVLQSSHRALQPLTLASLQHCPNYLRQAHLSFTLSPCHRRITCRAPSTRSLSASAISAATTAVASVAEGANKLKVEIHGSEHPIKSPLPQL